MYSEKEWPACDIPRLQMRTGHMVTSSQVREILADRLPIGPLQSTSRKRRDDCPEQVGTSRIYFAELFRYQDLTDGIDAHEENLTLLV
jgi:hypothetical protein